MKYSDIINTLAGAGIDVAHPGAKQTICLAPYAVVQVAGTYPFAVSRRLGYTLITVHCYVPLSSYQQLSVLTERVRAALRSLEPDLRPTGGEGVHLINDKFRAHHGTVQYMLLRRL